MTGAGPCGEMRQSLGVYLLGAIGPADRSAVDGHLALCGDCRAELAGLAGLPALLGRVPADEVSGMTRGEDYGAGGYEPPAGPGLVSMLGRAGRLRRRRLWRELAVAAAAGLIVGTGTVAAARGLAPSAPAPAASGVPWTGTARGTNPQTHASATVSYLARPWGLELDVQVSGIPAGTRCELQVISARGPDVTAGSWTIAAGHLHAWYPASSSASLSGVRGFVVTAATGARKALVSIPIR